MEQVEILKEKLELCIRSKTVLEHEAQRMQSLLDVLEAVLKADSPESMFNLLTDSLRPELQAEDFLALTPCLTQPNCLRSLLATQETLYFENLELTALYKSVFTGKVKSVLDIRKAKEDMSYLHSLGYLSLLMTPSNIGDTPVILIALSKTLGHFGRPHNRYLKESASLIAQTLSQIDNRFARLETQQALKDKQLTQERLLQSDKFASIGQMAAGIAHEINNPIGFVLSNLTSLDEYLSDYKELLHKTPNAEEITDIEADIYELIQDSLMGLTRVRDIVAGLKNFARSDKDDWAQADINDIILNAVKLSNNEVKDKASIDTLLSPNLDCCYVQESKLTQVFINLIINAAQAMGKDMGKITITSDQTKDLIFISVIDNGSGMTKEVMDKIFEPFFTTKPQGIGTGMGMAISYGIIQAHHGKIDIESKLGQGSTFTLSIPKNLSSDDL